MIKRLTDQVRKGVRMGDPHKPTGRTPPIIRKFCQALPEVREVLRTDMEAAFEGDPATQLQRRDHSILSLPGDHRHPAVRAALHLGECR